MHHFSEVIKDQIAVEAEGKDEDQKEQEQKDFDKLYQRTDGPRPNDWDIADVEFGKADMFDITYLNKLAVIRSEFLHNIARVKIIKEHDDGFNEEAITKLEEKNEELKGKWTEVLEQYNLTKSEKNEEKEQDDN